MQFYCWLANSKESSCQTAQMIQAGLALYLWQRLATVNSSRFKVKVVIGIIQVG
jgi:hypothetical protein